MAWSHDCVSDGDTDNCGACQDEQNAYKNINKIGELIVEKAKLQQEVERLKADVEVSNKLIQSRTAVIKLIPPCPTHGDQCLPHAEAWIREHLKG